ncbi:chitinase [uncultured Kocuria sp.]|uniref:chitinase n=1 Tax=uncultured Kocuria sp. TaxID=259305 RepID=UPI00260C2511|nr:chitinase [uncultured Kocuria sp.]
MTGRRHRLLPPLLLGCAAGLLLTGCGPDLRTPWFGGYVNATSYPYFDFGTEAAGQSHTVLGFVVADPEDPCTPSWGGYYGLEEAETTLRMEEQIAALREQGGEAVISFGGAARDELATVCTDPERLREAYATVLDRYGVTTADFDIENDDLGDRQAHERRAEALARLQGERDEPLDVWVTLPVAPQGLDEDSVDAVARMLSAGVDVAGVNLMTMNYSESKPAEQSVVAASEEAARSAHGQLTALWEAAGQDLSAEEVWNRIGLTPMIGVNDVPGEVLDLDAAAELAGFARQQGVGRLSYWSLNRDRPCTPADGDPAEANDFCSGLEEKAGEFTRVLGEGFGA